ncbi:prenyltransferase/squalene oxidase repeat-containing protein [Amycolatopsis sp. cg5]|uniref:prenyltransferase/squalene oxidase repeat-containing protein n=1 Tax=Amycolatopsis sp. cg5 TaxID=3238802 RepID=UPI003523DEEE
MPTEPSTAVDANQALDLAVGFAGRTQDPEGFWEQSPDPRIFDTAITVICLTAGGVRGREAAGRARQWLAGASPQRHDSFATAVETWLRQLALSQIGGSVPALPGNHQTPPGRALLLETLAVCAGSPGADPHRLRQIVADAGRRDTMKQWQRALLAAAEIISGARSGSTTTIDAVEALEREQGEDGGYCLMPAVTSLAYIALASVAADRPSALRCLDYLLRSQHADGTWRYLSFDIWDTTLMVRSLRGVPAFDGHMLDAALGFVERAQSADGGWACKRGIESDNDTTGSALLALAGLGRDRDVLSAGARYLRRVQREDGLWTTWQSSDDTPSSDVTAHVVAAAAAHPTLGIETERATTWLISRYQVAGGWGAQWYRSSTYAVAEIASAVGWTRDVSSDAVLALVGQQRADGGWPISDTDTCSDPAATGLALSTCARSGLAISPGVLLDAVDYLVRTQTSDGTWHGLPIMAGPRPFLSHLPRQTHAFASAGLRDFVSTTQKP